jgi:tetratricopeptide (TPR) repeat protein
MKLELPFTIALLIFVGIIAGDSYAQSKSGSIKLNKKSSYKNFRDRSSAAPSVLKEAEDLKTNSPAESLSKVQEALGLSIAQGDEFTEAKCYLLLGEINENIQEWRLALDNYTRAYQKLQVLNIDSPEYRRALQGLGISSTMLEKYEDALGFLNEAVKRGTGVIGNNAYVAERRIDISEVYYRMGNYDDALKVISEDEDSDKALQQQAIYSRLQNQKAKIYARMNELGKSRAILDNSVNSSRGLRKPDAQEQQSFDQSKEEVATVLRGQNRADEEISLRNQAIEYNLEAKNFAEVTKDKIQIGKTLEAKGETKAAIREMEEAAVIADTINNPKEQANAFLALAGLYEKNGRTPQALAAYRKYSQAIEKAQQASQVETERRLGLIQQQKDIDELTSDVSYGQQEETLEQATLFRQRLVIYGLLGVIVLTMTGAFLIYRSGQQSKVANQMLALKSLRSQMNPHFIFNALNSVNHFIAQQDERTANKFLSEFSQLMRLVMENSQEDFISLHKEQEILSLYLKLEHYRFRDKFDYQIEVDKNINADAVEVPPMLIQPYIENAVWHGLRYKDAKGKLDLSFRKELDNIVVEVTDNGIGRKKSAELKTENQRKHNSTGLKNIQERLQIINRVYHANYRVSVEDLMEGAGTRVRIFLPFTRNMNGV